MTLFHVTVLFTPPHLFQQNHFLKSGNPMGFQVSPAMAVTWSGVVPGETHPSKASISLVEMMSHYECVHNDIVTRFGSCYRIMILLHRPQILDMMLGTWNFIWAPGLFSEAISCLGKDHQNPVSRSISYFLHEWSWRYYLFSSFTSQTCLCHAVAICEFERTSCTYRSSYLGLAYIPTDPSWLDNW